MVAELTFDVVANSMRRLAIAGLEPCEQRLRLLPRLQQMGLTSPTSAKIQYELSHSQLKKGAVQKFQPMPVPEGCHLAFFRPTFYPTPEPEECKIEVLLIRDTEQKEILGFRFERGREEDDTHGHPHVQLTRSFRDGLETDWPKFVHESYPAFPTRSWSLGDTWLTVLVSLYGLTASGKRGVEFVISEIERRQRVDLCTPLMPRTKHIFITRLREA